MKNPHRQLLGDLIDQARYAEAYRLCLRYPDDIGTDIEMVVRMWSYDKGVTIDQIRSEVSKVG